MKIDKHYDIWSKIYDSNINPTRDLDQALTKKVLSKLKFKNVLELGCGTGKNTKWLISKSEKIVCVDFSKKMLAVAKQKIKSPKVEFVNIDLNNKWNLSNEKFDLVTINLTLEHIEDLNAIFKKSFNRLNPKGYLFISELHPFKQYIGSKARYEVNNEINELKTYKHNISDYLNAGKKTGFKIIELEEWFDKNNQKSLPRLISFVFQKI